MLFPDFSEFLDAVFQSTETVVYTLSDWWYTSPGSHHDVLSSDSSSENFIVI